MYKWPHAAMNSSSNPRISQQDCDVKDRRKGVLLAMSPGPKRSQKFDGTCSSVTLGFCVQFPTSAKPANPNARAAHRAAHARPCRAISEEALDQRQQGMPKYVSLFNQCRAPAKTANIPGTISPSACCTNGGFGRRVGSLLTTKDSSPSGCALDGSCLACFC